MRFDHLLRVFAVVLLVATTADHPAGAKSCQQLNPHNDASAGRLLRVRAASPATEERGVASAVKMWAKTQYWYLAEKSDDYVKTALGLRGLDKSAMAASPNYKYLQMYRYKVEGRVLDKWFYKGYSTQTIWSRYKLERIPEDQLATNPKFRIYSRYANKYDDAIYDHKNTALEPPIYYDESAGELDVKLRMWAEKQRPDWYVKEMLLLDEVPEALLKSDTHYKNFLKLKREYRHM